MTQSIHPTRQSEFLAGVRDTFPLVVGAIPFGIIFGALSDSSGISPAGTMGLSLLVFAGSAQFIGVSLWAGGAAAWVIIFTTFIVNLRHALYSATLAPHMKHLSQKWLLPLGFWLTDETFVVVVQRYNRHDGSPYKHWYHLGSSIFMYANWVACTVIGLVAGQTIPNLKNWGLDFALYVTFIGMLIPLIKNRPLLVSAVVAGLSAVLFHSLPNQMGLIIAALLGVAAGVIAERLLPPETELETTTIPQSNLAGTRYGRNVPDAPPKES